MVNKDFQFPKFLCCELNKKVDPKTPTAVFNTAKGAHFVNELSHIYTPKCTIWYII